MNFMSWLKIQRDVIPTWAIQAVNSSRTQLIKRVSVVSDDGVASTSSGESSDQEQIQDVCKDWLEDQNSYSQEEMKRFATKHIKSNFTGFFRILSSIPSANSFINHDDCAKH